jgi:hypothetical protein
LEGKVKCLSYQTRADGLCVLPTWTDEPPVTCAKPVDQELINLLFEEDKQQKPVKALFTITMSATTLM